MNQYSNTSCDHAGFSPLECRCHAVGVTGSGHCDPGTGQCPCKRRVEGRKCNECKSRYWNLQASNTDGCESMSQSVYLSVCHLNATCYYVSQVAAVTALALFWGIGSVTRRQANAIAKAMLLEGSVTHAGMDTMA